jgi:ATP-binding cassette subfamily B multidrug efflux pump
VHSKIEANHKLNHKSAIDLWRKFLKDRSGIYFLGGLAVLLTNLMQILAPKNIGWIVDFFANKSIPSVLTGPTKEATFVKLFIVLVFSRVFINVFRFMWRITLGRQTHHACAMLRKDVWEHVRYFKKDDLDNKFTKGVLMNAEVSDTNSARFIFGFTLVAIFDLIFLGIFTFITMALIHWKMALCSFLVLTFVPFFVQKLSKQEIEQYRKIQDVLSHFNDLSSQAVSTIKLQRLTQTGPFWEKRLMNVASNHREQRLKGLNLSLTYIPIMGLASIISYVILFALGIHFTFKNQMTVGEFISMQGLIFLLHDPLMTFGFVISEWKKAFTALERLTNIYNYPKDEHLLNKGKNIQLSNEVLSVKHLNYSYIPGEKIINDISFSLNIGDRLGITGPIGSGKSTLLMVLSGLDRHFDGNILFLGNDFKEYSHDDLRREIGIVNQKPFLFADSIKLNVSVDLNLSDEEIWKYLEIAGLKDDVLNFPDQLNTELGEWGINLSGGQKQRLTLARALARKPKLLFLDDCLSAVDTITEERILKLLDEHLKETTLVWVAHRKSTLKYCNRTIDLGTIH